MTRVLKLTMAAVVLLASASVAMARVERYPEAAWRYHNAMSQSYDLYEPAYASGWAREHGYRRAIEPLTSTQKKFLDKAVGFD